MAGGDHTLHERRDLIRGIALTEGIVMQAKLSEVQIYSAGFCGGRLVSSLSLLGLDFFAAGMLTFSCCRR